MAQGVTILDDSESPSAVSAPAAPHTPFSELVKSRKVTAAVPRAPAAPGPSTFQSVLRVASSPVADVGRLATAYGETWKSEHPNATARRILTDIGEAGADVTGALTNPTNLALLAAMVYQPEAGLPAVVRTLMNAGFGIKMAWSAAKGAKQAGEEWKAYRVSGDKKHLDNAVKFYTESGLDALLVTLGGRQAKQSAEAIGPEAPPAPIKTVPEPPIQGEIVRTEPETPRTGTPALGGVPEQRALPPAPRPEAPQPQPIMEGISLRTKVISKPSAKVIQIPEYGPTGEIVTPEMKYRADQIVDKIATHIEQSPDRQLIIDKMDYSLRLYKEHPGWTDERVVRETDRHFGPQLVPPRPVPAAVTPEVPAESAMMPKAAPRVPKFAQEAMGKPSEQLVSEINKMAHEVSSFSEAHREEMEERIPALLAGQDIRGHGGVAWETLKSAVTAKPYEGIALGGETPHERLAYLHGWMRKLLNYPDFDDFIREAPDPEEPILSLEATRRSLKPVYDLIPLEDKWYPIDRQTGAAPFGGFKSFENAQKAASGQSVEPETASESPVATKEPADGAATPERAQESQPAQPAPTPDPAPTPNPTVQPPQVPPVVASAPEPAIPEAPPASGITEVQTRDLKVDPERFQFKRDVGVKGVGEKLKKSEGWDPFSAGVLTVWRDPGNGQDYVVNGHHRFDLAKRLRVENVAVRYVPAETANEAMVAGAILNIREGQGTAIDAARIFRLLPTAPEDTARAIGLTDRKIDDAVSLSKLAEPIWRKVYLGQLPEKVGIAIEEESS